MAGTSSQRLSRLLNLIAALTETNLPLTAKQIRARLGDDSPSDEAFRKRFERDKRELRDLGIEIELTEAYDPDPEPAYRIPRSQYALRLPDLEADEIAALQLAVGLVRLEGVHGADALWKLGTAAAPEAAGDAGSEGLADLPANPQLGPLFTALSKRRPVRFRYRGRERHVDPLRLDFARGRWYLRAFDRDEQEGRWYRLDRMESTPLLGPAGDARAVEEEDVEVPDPWSIPDGEAVTARVRVDGPQARMAVAVVGEAAVVEESEDGSVVIELEVTHRDGFRDFVLSHLEHAEVLSPPELRAEIVAWLEALAGEDR